MSESAKTVLVVEDNALNMKLFADLVGAIGHRVQRTDDLVPILDNAFKEGGVQLVTVPIDYAENTRVLVEELRGHVPEIA